MICLSLLQISLIEKARSFAAKRQPKTRFSDLHRSQTMPTDLQQYLKTMIDLVTETVYRVVSRALFAKHQLFFSFYLCVRIHMHSSSSDKPLIENPDWQFFLNGSNTTLFSSSVDGEPMRRRGNGSLFYLI